MLSVRRAGVEPAQPRRRLGYRPVGLADAQSTHVFKWRRRESNPQSPRFELRRFADLRTAPFFQAPSTGFEPAISCVTGRRALQAAPRGHDRSSGSGGSRTHSIPGSKPRWSAGCLPSRSAQSGSRTRKRSGLSRAALPRWRIWAEVVPDGVEPSFPGCRPGVVAVGPRDRVSQVESPGVAPGSPACGAGVVLLDHDPDFERKPWGSNPQAACLPPPAFQAGSSTSSDGFRYRVTKAEAVRLELTSGCSPPPVFKTGSSSGRMASVSSCGGWNRTNMKTFRASHPAVR